MNIQKNGFNKMLKLINDSINCFDEELLNFPNLSLLELEDNQISEIPYYLFNLKNLNSIGISGNMITTITVPNEIDTSIKYLNLENNRLTMIPKGLENLKGLLLLYLGNNDSLNLEEICNLIPSLPNLEWMDIRNIRKRIHTPLPKNIANLAKVKRIVHLSTSDFTKEELIEMEKLGIKLPKAKTDW
jgi:Leucine-rich repeat (LRR) protein